MTDAQTELLSALASDTVDDWRGAVLRRLCSVVGADRGMLLMSSGSRIVNAEGFTPAEIDDYEAVFPNDPGRALVRSLGLEVWTHTRLLQPDPDIFYKSSAYHEFYRPRRLEDGIGYLVESSDHVAYAVLKLHHARARTRNFGERGRALLGLLLPAFKAGVRSWEHAPLGGPLTGLIDELEDGVVLFDHNGDPLHRNAALHRLLDADQQRVLIEDAVEEVRRSVELARASGRNSRTITERLASGTPYNRALTTAGGRYEIWGTLIRDVSAAARTLVAVFVRSSGITLAAIGMAGSHFGLTRREVQVLAHLVRGATAKEVAAALGVRVSTARRHTEAVMRKCGVHSRNAMGQLVLSLSRNPREH